METQYISLNMTPTGVNPCFHISQYDVGRMLGFIVHSGGTTVDLDSYTCTIEATRSDGVAITASVATDDNIGTFEVTPTMSNKADKYRCQLVIVDENSKRIASLPFDMEVTKAAMDENSEAIEEDASLYQQYTNSVQSMLAEARSGLQTEISTRTTQDGLLQAQINQIIAPSGEAPSAAEVQNARIGADGATYDTLGNAIRGQVNNLKSDLVNYSKYHDVSLVWKKIITISGSDGTWKEYSDYTSVVVEVEPNRIYSIKNKSGKGPARYTFMKTANAVVGEPVDFASGYNSLSTINDNTEIVVSSPSDAKYLWMSLVDNNQNSTLYLDVSLYNHNNIITFNTFDELINCKSVLNGDICYTKGYYAINDGGGALYNITEYTNETIFSKNMRNLNLNIELVHDKVINVLQLGVKRENYYESDIVQNIINGLNERYTLYFPYGRYFFNNTITLKNKVSLLGDITTWGELDRLDNGTRFYFQAFSNAPLIDGTDNFRYTIKNIYVYSDAVNFSSDRNLISDGTTPVDIFTKTINRTNMVGIDMGSDGCTLENVIIRGVQLGIKGGTANNFSNVHVWHCEKGFEFENDNLISNIRAFHCEKFFSIGSLNQIVNARCDNIRYNAIDIYGNANNINNLCVDFAQYSAIEVINGDNNFVAGTIGRCGTYYNNVPRSAISSALELRKNCYVYLKNGANNNKFIISATKRNPMDITSNYLTPLYTITTTGSNLHNDFDLYGNVAESTEYGKKLAIEKLWQIYTPLESTSNDYATLKYKGISYALKGVASGYTQYQVFYSKLISLSE